MLKDRRHEELSKCVYTNIMLFKHLHLEWTKDMLKQTKKKVNKLTYYEPVDC